MQALPANYTAKLMQSLFRRSAVCLIGKVVDGDHSYNGQQRYWNLAARKKEVGKNITMMQTMTIRTYQMYCWFGMLQTVALCTQLPAHHRASWPFPCHTIHDSTGCYKDVVAERLAVASIRASEAVTHCPLLTSCSWPASKQTLTALNTEPSNAGYALHRTNL